MKRDELSTSEFREKCQAYAEDFVNKQREQFKRLGVLGEWEDPYLTQALPSLRPSRLRSSARWRRRALSTRA